VYEFKQYSYLDCERWVSCYVHSYSTNISHGRAVLCLLNSTTEVRDNTRSERQSSDRNHRDIFCTFRVRRAGSFPVMHDRNPGPGAVTTQPGTRQLRVHDAGVQVGNPGSAAGCAARPRRSGPAGAARHGHSLARSEPRPRSDSLLAGIGPGTGKPPCYSQPQAENDRPSHSIFRHRASGPPSLARSR
jgi:hypothetical protein